MKTFTEEEIRAVCVRHQEVALKKIEADPPKLRDTKDKARMKAYWQGYFEGIMNAKFDLVGGNTTPVDGADFGPGNKPPNP